MTRNELIAKLDSLSDEDVEQFCRDFGGGVRSRASLVRDFVDHPEYERRMCQLLGTKTEDERLADAAACSAKSARWSMIWAFVSTVISIAAFALSILAFLQRAPS